MERAALIAAAVAGLAVAIWQALRAAAARRQLGQARAQVVVAELDAAQADVDAAAAKAREEAAAKQRDAIAKLNQEVVRVDPNGGDLAGAFDRATGGAQPIGPDDVTPKPRG